MLRRTFNPDLPHQAVLYLRMSSDLQNKRSPDQQEDTIRQCMAKRGLNWKAVKVYRDEAKSGRLTRNRPQYQQMLRDIQSGTLQVDLILVDTLERFGRVEELPTIRKMLYETHGVLVLTADSSFADPTTTAGMALGFVESMRATEHGRILGHNVLRGKRDTAKLKRWPGGPCPFGFMLKSVMKVENGREVVDHSMLVPDPKSAWIITLLFKKADETSWGTNRLAKFLNACEDISDSLKPFHPSTVGRWLDNPIYYGELLWEKNCTGIAGGQRVVERNQVAEWLRIPEFCEPLVERELWDRVQAKRALRRKRTSQARNSNGNSPKQIEAPAPGISLKYLLSGLIYCDDCGLRMTLSSSGGYKTASGEMKRYPSYVCPGYIAGNCKNGKRVPEQWLREVVIFRLRERLFPVASTTTK